MINSKLTKQVMQQTSEEKLFKLLESIDWKLWEMYNIMKAESNEEKPAPKKTTRKTQE